MIGTYATFATRRIAAALLLLSLPVVAACAGRRASQPSRAVRVLVYNIHAGKDAGGVDAVARVAALVRELDADVVLLQEVDRRTKRSGGVDQPAELSRLTGYQAAFGRTLDYDGGEYGIAVLSRWPIARDTLVHLPIDPPQQRAGGSYEPRGALRVVVNAPFGAMAVVNTHLDAGRDDAYRRQEIRTVLAIADSLRASGLPTLLGGDFNSTPESAVHEAATAAGLRDAWRDCGRGDSLTFPAGVPVKRIDYLYLSGAATCSEATVPVTQASDHRPLFVLVGIR
jgi:endonuclease/exonuclease/phosphatase family metal-dependent hydrolase